MLGRYVNRYLSDSGHYVVPAYRSNFNICNVGLLDVKNFIYTLHPDVVINCAGIIKSRVGSASTIETVQVNSMFPLLLLQARKGLILMLQQMGLHRTKQ